MNKSPEYICRGCGKVYKKSNHFENHERNCSKVIELDELAEQVKIEIVDDDKPQSIEVVKIEKVDTKISFGVAEKLVEMQLHAAQAIQYSYHKHLADFDVLVEEKQDRLIKIHEAILKKHGIVTKLEPELVLAGEYSTLLLRAAAKKRMLLQNKNKIANGQPPTIIEDAADSDVFEFEI